MRYDECCIHCHIIHRKTKLNASVSVSIFQVLLTTTLGDIDIELWSREAPKACRNFIQLCMEGYYNGTIFHRIMKDFIAQGGDPTGTGEGGESVYGKPFRVSHVLHVRSHVRNSTFLFACDFVVAEVHNTISSKINTYSTQYCHNA